jgi:glutamate/tyrosine decarboxylase-like PLP-dependent enzyme
MVGLGSRRVLKVEADDQGRMRPDRLRELLAGVADRPVIVSAQSGNVNTGAFDPLTEIVDAVRALPNAWLHVDGAFGLWAATSERHKHYLDGVAQADSWVTDGHKWLNLPFDSGFVFVADADAHRAVFSQVTSYAVPVDGVREQKDWNPEWSRRGRGFTAYAAIRELGRAGIGEMVARCCDFATDLVEGLAAMRGVEVLSRPTINQGLVRFLDQAGNHDARTDRVIAAVQASGVAWFGGTTWRGRRAMRISVCNWRTTGDDVQRTLAAFRAILD